MNKRAGMPLEPADSMEEALRRHGLAHYVYHEPATGRICMSQAAVLAAGSTERPTESNPGTARNLRALVKTAPENAWTKSLRQENKAAREANKSEQQRDMVTVELLNNRLTEEQAMDWARRADREVRKEADAQ